MGFSVRPATFATSLNAYESAAPGNLQVTADPIVSTRDDLNRTADENREKVKRLQQELERVKDDAGSGWGVFEWLFGDDSGVAEVSGETKQAKEECGSSGALFGTIFGGPLIGTHVGSTIAEAEAARETKTKPPQAVAFVSSDSSTWRSALPKDPD